MPPKILLTAATQFELNAVFPSPLGALASVEARVTGVGIPATFAHLHLTASSLPSLVLNVGIAGAYPETGIAIGDIVLAASEVYGDIGFETPYADGFRAIADSPFGDFYREQIPTVTPPEWTRLNSPNLDFRVHVTHGCTVNACTGIRATGIRRRDRFGAGFETMEGAAVAQVGRAAGIPVCEIRAISNRASDRDMRPENIRLALENLRRYLETCLGLAAVE